MQSIYRSNVISWYITNASRCWNTSASANATIRVRRPFSISSVQTQNTIDLFVSYFFFVPLPRMTLQSRAGMRTLENSSSSEEEDRADLLGRSFQVPRPKSRSNGSIAVRKNSKSNANMINKIVSHIRHFRINRASIMM